MAGNLANTAPFLVYNASAGSGKTYTLVKSFLEKLILQSNPDSFRHLLAITFTNKAVAEMKSRILKLLVQFSEGDTSEPAQNMAEFFEKEHGLNPSELQKRSQTILKHLLNNYALFSVETIDHFNHRILRTFSRDLGLNSNFEVSLETSLLLTEAVDELVAKAGEDPDITSWLVQYALQKTEEDKSWDISRDLRNSAQLLVQENDLYYLEKLRGKSLSAFGDLKTILNDRIRVFEKELQKKGAQLLQLFHENELDATHFDRGSVYRFFQSISQGNTDFSIELQWQDKVGVEALYPRRVENTLQAETIESLTPQIAESISWIRSNYPNYLKHKNILAHLIPLATVHLVDNQLQELKTTYNLLPISEFNSLIHKEIKDQPAPFIYERLGERYKHFFIDEFQDTSLLQWGNLQPLVENALSQTAGEGEASLMIVGDAKQSIYRWRGGLPEQFIGLYTEVNPFPFTEKSTQNLDTNFRSCEEIVSFNNRFFHYLSGQFDNPIHKKLYAEGSHQKSNNPCTGLVQLRFLESSNADEIAKIHPQAVREQIEALLIRGYRPGDICVLTRKRNEGVLISEVLAASGIKVVSEETLLLKNADSVKVLLDLLHVSLNPSDDEAKVRILEYVTTLLNQKTELHSWARRCIGKGLYVFQELLKERGMALDFRKTKSLGVFETLEYLVKAIGLDASADAFLVTFMDWTFQFSQNPMNGKSELLEFWELKKEELSISAPNNGGAVRVMTIHKSKGLEFPVVIFPFAHLDIYQELDPQIWYPWNSDGFEELLIRYKKEITSYGPEGAVLYQDHKSTLQLDNLNLLYVAMTRAQRELYVLSKKEFSQGEPKTYADFLQGFLQAIQLWEDSKNVYQFGKEQPPIVKDADILVSTEIDYPVSLPEERGLHLIGARFPFENSSGSEARAFGSVFHEFMALIHKADDLENAWAEISSAFPHLIDQLETLPQTAKLLMENALLRDLFHGTATIFVEKDIITPEGVIRPDRMNFHEDRSVTLLDYKTGAPRDSDKIQMQHYSRAIQEMGYILRDSILVYANPEKIIVNKAYL